MKRQKWQMVFAKRQWSFEGDLVKQGMTYDGESGEQTKNRDDRENIDKSKANLDAKSEMTDRENLFSDIDSDVENQTDGDADLTDIINTLADEIIETLAEETVSKYYGIEGNEKKEGQTRNPPLESSDKLHKVNSSDVESEEDNLSLAKLKALNELKHTFTRKYSDVDVYGGIPIKKPRRIGRKNNTQKVC